MVEQTFLSSTFSPPVGYTKMNTVAYNESINTANFLQVHGVITIGVDLTGILGGRMAGLTIKVLL